MARANERTKRMPLDYQNHNDFIPIDDFVFNTIYNISFDTTIENYSLDHEEGLMTP